MLNRIIKFDYIYTLKSGSWLLSGQVLSMLSILITSYFFANYLDPQTYGIYKYLITAGVIVSAFSLTGLNTTITQAVAKGDAGYFLPSEKISLKYGLVVAGLSLFCATYYWFNDNEQLFYGFIILALFQPLANTTNLISSVFVGQQKFKILIFSHGTKAIFVSLVTILTIYLSGDILLTLSLSFGSNIIFNVLSKKIFLPRQSQTIDTNKVNYYTSYAKHISIQNVISTLANNLDKVLIFQNLGAADLAKYAFATALPDQYKGITKAIETMVLPRFSQYSDTAVRKNMIYKTLVYILFLTILCCTYILIAPFIFTFLYPAYAESVFLSQIYTLGILFGISSLPISAMKARMEKKRLYVFNLTTSVFQILILLLLLPIYGLIGAIIARVLHRGFVALIAYSTYFLRQ